MRNCTDAAPGGKIGHAEIEIGDSVIMLSDEMPGCVCQSPQSLGGTTCSVFLNVEDADAVFDRATSAGAQVQTPLADMFWGDRFGTLKDPFGYFWSLAMHKEDVAPAEMSKRRQEAVAKMSRKTKSAH